MTTIGNDFDKEDQPEWNWVPHGDGWALMQGRHSARHGLNKLTVRPESFDWGGAELRALIAKLLNEHAEKTRAESAVERLASMLHEPLVLPPGYPSLGERLIGAVDMLYREIHSLKAGECDLLLLQRAWAPVVRAALAWRKTREREVFPELADSVDALTGEQREAAEP
jgi:hypothetical protein